MSISFKKVIIKEVDASLLKEFENELCSNMPVIPKPLIKNPFKPNLKITTADKIKYVLLFGFIILRIILTILAYMLGAVVSCIANYGYDNTAPHVPVTRFYKKIETIGWKIAWLVPHIMGLRVTVKGKLASKDEAPIIVIAPHHGMVDNMILPSVGDVTYLAWSGILKIPLLGWGFKVKFPIVVGKNNGGEKVNKVINQRSVDPDWPQIVIFPAGTCTTNQSLIKFRKGAFLPGYPVQPIILRYQGKEDCTTWTDLGCNYPVLFFIFAAQWTVPVELEILPVYTPSEEEKSDPNLFAENVRQVMSQALGIPTTEFSFEDGALMREAKRLGMPMEAGLIEYFKISAVTGMNLDETKSRLKRFAKIDSKKDGQIDLIEFCDYLQIPVCTEAETLFKIYDIDEKNCISFREFLLGFHYVTRRFMNFENVKEMFKSFQNGEEKIDVENFEKDFMKFLCMERNDSFGIFNTIQKLKPAYLDFNAFHDICLSKPELCLLFCHFLRWENKDHKIFIEC